MSEKVKFTEQEERELRHALKMGGIFLKVIYEPSMAVEVLTADGNGSWKTIKLLDEVIASKIHTLYTQQQVYKAPVKAGFCTVSLSWFIAEYC